MSEQTPPTNDNDQARIGTDEWVAQVASRQRGGNPLLRRWEQIPERYRYAGILLIALIFPFFMGTEFILNAFDITDNSFILRIAVRFLTFAIMAIGLNVVVGYAGLLDLGYIAFMGLAGYFYAYLSSTFVVSERFIVIPNGLALPSIFSIPLIMLAVAGIGYLIGSVSIRLAGDYLAIVTLGFGQVFLSLALTLTRVPVPWSNRPV
ncbi:MAG: hypothetical protein KDE04_04130, partial [Anaerolineales bacterium]|nr:hypothetical protein [Anaerolineales bacterium]